ncbi:MAG: DUF4830 domain-containing protein [Acutalibacteraceae bacterium]
MRSEESFHGHHDCEGPQAEDCCSSCCCFIAAAVVLALCLERRGQAKRKSPRRHGTRGRQRTRRASPFWRSYGWEVERGAGQDPAGHASRRTPARSSCATNELQISQGYDLPQYSGQELTRYVYRITNYPDRKRRVLRDASGQGRPGRRRRCRLQRENRRDARAEDA